MKSTERREQAYIDLLNSKRPLKGQKLAQKYDVTRQVIVKDIAILRAEGKEIVATPDGYIVQINTQKKINKIIAISHGKNEIEQELKIVLKYGGTIKDVIVEHPVYGEIKANLMIKSLYDLENFISKIEEYNAQPLLSLTGGIHLHTIETDNKESIKKIVEELDAKGYLIK
ncbi:3H domain-containing protein [Clostridium sp. DL1XJH146]